MSVERLSAHEPASGITRGLNPGTKPHRADRNPGGTGTEGSTAVKRIFALGVALLLATAAQLAAAVSETDALIQLLLTKGIITAEEAANLRAELAVAKQEEKDKQKEAPVTAAKPLQLSGYAELRYRQVDYIKDSFDVRRARLDLRGAFGKGFDYRLQVDAAGSSAKLLDAALRWRYDDRLALIGGQFKIPFSQENLQSSNKMELINRSMVVGALVARGLDIIGEQNGRDIGLAANGSFPLSAGSASLEYAVGVFNGSGINRTDLNDQKDVVGRLVIKPMTGLSLGLSGYEGRYTLSSASGRRDIRRRLGAEFAVQQGPFLARGEYIWGRDADTERDGWYLLGGWMAVPGKLQLLYRYDRYDPDAALKGNTSRLDTLGVAWYFSKSAFLQLNYDKARGQLAKTTAGGWISQLTLQF